jgi:hypothetical protein
MTDEHLRAIAESDPLALAICALMGEPSWADVRQMAAELLAARAEIRRLRAIEAASKTVHSEMAAALDWHTSPHCFKQWTWALLARTAEMAEAALAAKED